MRALIISDIHDNLVNLERCLTWAQTQKLEALLCLGDVANPETLTYLLENYSGLVYLIRGNAEIYPESELKKYPYLNYLGRYGQFELANLKIGLVHEPLFIKKLIAEHPETNFDFIFHGHTHKPWLSQEDGITIANPGTLGGVFYEATFAVLDLENQHLDLKLLNDL